MEVVLTNFDDPVSQRSGQVGYTIHAVKVFLREVAMSLVFHPINFWAVLVSIVTNMVIGALWYSPVLFGNVWLKLIGKKAEEISKEDANKSMSFSIIPAVVSIGSLAFVLSLVNPGTLVDAIIVASVIAVGFIGMAAFNLVLFENRSVALTILNTGYSFVSLNVAAVVMTLWR